MQFENSIVVETGSGVGFEIFVHQGSPIYKHSEGDEIQVFTEMIVREDGMSLYGFHNKETLEFFRMLTTVSGIGPKGAMGILGSMPLSELKLAIAMGDVKSISKAQGVGKKTAERLVVELKDKVGAQDIDTETGEILSGGDFGGAAADDARSEAISALMSLGSMWGVRLTLAALLAGTYGLAGVWTAMAIELTFRGFIFLIRLWRFGK